MALKGDPTHGYTELLFCQNGAGTANTGTTAAGTATLISQRSTTYPLPSLDLPYFQAQFGIAKPVRVVARGVITTVASNTQTLIVGCAYATSDTATIGTTIGATGAFTPAASLSSAIWELELDFFPTAAGSSGTLQALGQLQVSPTTATGVTIGVGGSSTVTYNTEAAAFLQIYSTWGASGTSVTNTLTCYQVLILGLS